MSFNSIIIFLGIIPGSVNPVRIKEKIAETNSNPLNIGIIVVTL